MDKRLHMRLDNYTIALLEKIMSTTGRNKSRTVRDAIEYYAHHVLSNDEIMNIRLYQHFNKDE